MSRFRPRQTLEQALAQTVQSPSEWPEETVPEILSVLWEAYDRLFTTRLNRVNLNEADKELERSVTALLHNEIAFIMHQRGGFASYLVCHESWEMETIMPDSKRPPQYDIAFVWHEYPHLKWPCEAKVIRTENAVAPYISDIQTAFIPCIYAPFSSSAAMLGFLVKGSPENTIRAIEKKLSIKTVIVQDFANRPHRLSIHDRAVPSLKKYPDRFTLHHLVFNLQ